MPASYDNPIYRIIGVLGAALLVGLAFFLGAFLLAVILGLATLALILFRVRLWWLRRQMSGSSGGRKGQVIEGEFVLHESRQEQDREDHHG